MRPWRVFGIILFLLAGSSALMGLAAAQPPVNLQATPTSSSSLMSPLPSGGLIYSNLPANASQVDYGKEAYRLVCGACHGDKGQGLTADWIATWAPEDQNCWQSKCHAGNHPPDGFALPHTVPAIFNRDELQLFKTALDLETFIQDNMPWQNPGELKPEEYFNITAYILKVSGIDPMNQVLTSHLAASIPINPNAQPIAAPTPQPRIIFASAAQPFWLGFGIFMFFLIILGIAPWLDSRRTKQ